MSPGISNGDIVVIHESTDIHNLNCKIYACQTLDGITLKKVQFDARKRVILIPLNQQYEAIILEEYELETFRILSERALLFRVV